LSQKSNLYVLKIDSDTGDLIAGGRVLTNTFGYSEPILARFSPNGDQVYAISYSNDQGSGSISNFVIINGVIYACGYWNGWQSLMVFSLADGSLQRQFSIRNTGRTQYTFLYFSTSVSADFYSNGGGIESAGNQVDFFLALEDWIW
jgi:hypothetical protein